MRPSTCAVGLLLGVLGCGGPPVGSHVPRPNPNAVAAGAAAVAMAAAVADPAAAQRRAERPDDGRLPEAARTSGEMVPADVLERASGGDQARPASAEPCRTRQPDAAPQLELIPRPRVGGAETAVEEARGCAAAEDAGAGDPRPDRDDDRRREQLD